MTDEPSRTGRRGGDVTIQFRRYEVRPGSMDDFVGWWPKGRAVREAHGFRVLFAYAIHETDEFVWAIEHDGDITAFNAAVEVFRVSPERTEAFVENPRAWLANMHERFVGDVLV